MAQVVRSWTRGEERKEREQVNKRESCRDASTGASGAGDMEGARRPCLHRMARGSVHVLPRHAVSAVLVASDLLCRHTRHGMGHSTEGRHAIPTKECGKQH